jgi:nitrogen fixation protein FixH
VTAGTRWTLVIVGLLSVNVLVTVGLAIGAGSGASQVIPDYYETGVHYDTAIDRAAASRALGWRASASVAGGELIIAVRDASGAPVAGANVTVAGYQRAFASEHLSVALSARGDDYRAAFPVRAGVQDLTVTVERGRERFEQALAVVAR